MQITVKDIIKIMNKIAPVEFAESWDNPGLQVGNPNRNVNSILIALDVTIDVVKEAISKNVNMIITHHPLLFKSLKCIDTSTEKGQIIELLISNNIAAFAAHTNLDTVENGVNDALASVLNLKNCKGMVPGYIHKLYKLVVTIEEKYEKLVKDKLNFNKIIYINKNNKKYLNLEFTGKQEEIYKAKKEILKHINDATFECYELQFDAKQEMMGRIGSLEKELTAKDALKYIKEKLQLKVLKYAGNTNKMVKTIGVLGGSGVGFAKFAQKNGVDLYLTADLKYHDAQDAAGSGLLIVDGGHFYTENVIVKPLAKILKSEFKKLNYEVNVEAYTEGKDIFEYIV